MSVRFAKVLTLLAALVLWTPSAMAWGTYSFSDMSGGRTYSYWQYSSYPTSNFGCGSSGSFTSCWGGKTTYKTSWGTDTGYGSGWGQGSCNYCSISPVPEPETYAMLLAGLGLMGFILRRCKNRSA